MLIGDIVQHRPRRVGRGPFQLPWRTQFVVAGGVGLNLPWLKVKVVQGAVFQCNGSPI